MNRVLHWFLPVLGLSASAALFCLACYVAPSAGPRPLRSAAELGARPSFAERFSLADGVRNAVSWLDKTTTPKGAFFWPLTGGICGLPRR